MNRIALPLLASLLLCRLAQAAEDLTGIWVPQASPATLLTDAGELPPLLAAARAQYEQHLAARKSGDLSFDGTNKCQPPGVPRVYTMGMPFEIQQEADKVYMLFQYNRLVRVIDLDATHEQQAQYAPYYLGWSVGHWDGSTLNVDSVLFNDSTLLDTAGLPHSMDMHLTENWQLRGSQLTARFTIDDSANYSAPWSTTLRFKRAPPGTLIDEDICLERLPTSPAPK